MQGMVLSQVPPPTGREEVPDAIPTDSFDVCRNHIDRVCDGARTDIVAASNSDNSPNRRLNTTATINARSYIGSYADRASNTDGYHIAHADTFTNGHAAAPTYADAHADTHTNPDADAYSSTCYTNADTNGHAAAPTYADAHADTHTNPDADAYSSTCYTNADTDTDTTAGPRATRVHA